MVVFFETQKNINIITPKKHGIDVECVKELENVCQIYTFFLAITNLFVYFHREHRPRPNIIKTFYLYNA